MDKLRPFIPQDIERIVPSLDAPSYRMPETYYDQAEIGKEVIELGRELSEKGEEITLLFMNTNTSYGSIALKERVTASKNDETEWSMRLRVTALAGNSHDIFLRKDGSIYTSPEAKQAFYAFLDHPSDKPSSSNDSTLLDGLQTLFTRDRRAALDGYYMGAQDAKNLHTELHDFADQAQHKRMFNGKSYIVSSPSGTSLLIENLEEIPMRGTSRNIQNIADTSIPPPPFFRAQLLQLIDDDYASDINVTSLTIDHNAKRTYGTKERPDTPQKTTALLAEMAEVYALESEHPNPYESVFLTDAAAHALLSEATGELLLSGTEEIIEKTALIHLGGLDSIEEESISISERTNDDATKTHEVVWAKDGSIYLAAIIGEDGDLALLEEQQTSFEDTEPHTEGVATDSLSVVQEILRQIHDGDRLKADELPELLAAILEEEETITATLMEAAGKHNGKPYLFRVRTDPISEAEEYEDMYDFESDEPLKPVLSFSFYTLGSQGAPGHYTTILADKADGDDECRYLSFGGQAQSRFFDSPLSYQDIAQANPWQCTPKRSDIAQAAAAMQALHENALSNGLTELSAYLDNPTE